MSLSDWTPRERPGLSPLVGERVALEPLDWELHGDGLFEAVAGQENGALWTYIPIGPFGRFKTFRKVFAAVMEDQGWETLVIRSREDGVPLGMASYMRIQEAHGSVEVGCVVFGARLQRSIEATEAMYLMAQHVFEDHGYRRYEWKCNNSNEASCCAAERLGFLFEGVFRNDMVVKGENRDTAWFAMTDEDWPAIKAAFEAWLDPENFDEQGRQNRDLASFR